MHFTNTPVAYRASIYSYDVARSPTWFICTDASKIIGGGGWLPATAHTQHSADLHDVFYLRWSPDELIEFRRLSSVIHSGNQCLEIPDTTPLLEQVRINILESAAAIFALIKWSPRETP